MYVHVDNVIKDCISGKMCILLLLISFGATKFFLTRIKTHSYKHSLKALFLLPFHNKEELK